MESARLANMSSSSDIKAYLSNDLKPKKGKVGSSIEKRSEMEAHIIDDLFKYYTADEKN